MSSRAFTLVHGGSRDRLFAGFAVGWFRVLEHSLLLLAVLSIGEQEKTQCDDDNDQRACQPAGKARFGQQSFAILGRNVVGLIDHVAKSPANFAGGKGVGKAQPFQIVVGEANGIGEQKPHVPGVEA